MYMFAFMAAAMYMGRPLCPLEQRTRQPEGIIGRAAVVMKLLMACSGLAEQNVGQLMDVNGVSGSSVTTTMTAVRDVVHSPQHLGTSTEEALERLTNLIKTDAFLNVGREASSLNASYPECSEVVTCQFRNGSKIQRNRYGILSRMARTRGHRL
ncbi:Serine/threonine-protein kinase [Venturia nashicola]|uniref:Serine/threonine-protein kinase n=1 Tax=Venturia nashicola TaxID=86259 RepID=A0A4Z1NPJ3_9PEZI|nr:Serine/threonine-protein kinase [Venturia nashicola]